MNKTSKTATALGLAAAMVAVVSVSAHDNGNDKGRNDSYGEHLVKLGYSLVPPGVKLNLQGQEPRPGRPGQLRRQHQRLHRLP
jgi:hypothetical protein